MNITVTILYCMPRFVITRSYMGICMSAVRVLGSMAMQLVAIATSYQSYIAERTRAGGSAQVRLLYM